MPHGFVSNFENWHSAIKCITIGIIIVSMLRTQSACSHTVAQLISINTVFFDVLLCSFSLRTQTITWINFYSFQLLLLLSQAGITWQFKWNANTKNKTLQILFCSPLKEQWHRIARIYYNSIAYSNIEWRQCVARCFQRKSYGLRD